MKRTVHIPKLGKEQVLDAAKLTNPEVRFVVSDYYICQEARKRCDMQLRHLGDKEPSPLLRYTADCNAIMEQQTLKMLAAFAQRSNVGRWMMAQHGVGPVITSACLAHFDIERAPTAGHFWSYAGLNPDAKWEEGEIRPWNAQLKVIMYHLGECIKRTWKSGELYGELYGSRKKLLEDRNEAGHNKERSQKFFTKSAEWKKILKTGKLPPGNIDRQACNFVAKIFISHLHALMYWDKYGKPPPKPFGMAILGHAHMIKVPKAEDFFPGFSAAYYNGADEPVRKKARQ